MLYPNLVPQIMCVYALSVPLDSCRYVLFWVLAIKDPCVHTYTQT